MDVLTGSAETVQSKRCVALFEDAKDRFSEKHKAISEELDFALKQNHYLDDAGNTKDRSRIQPKGIQLFNLVRYQAGQISKAGKFREVRPVDNMTDEAHAELAKFVLEHIIDNPDRMYSEHRERMVVGALTAGIWGMEWFYDPSDGPFGEINFAAADPRNNFWGTSPGVFLPQQSRCPWHIKFARMTLDELHTKKDEGWNKKAIDSIHPNSMMGDRNGSNLAYDQFRLGGIIEPAMRGSRLPTVDLIICRFKRDPGKKKVTRDPFRVLPPNQRYMQCLTCVFKTYEHPKVNGELPPQGAPCPNCGVDVLRRIDSEQIEEDLLAYPDGRLTILDPMSGKVFFDDVWPEKLRGFPCAFYEIYPHPSEECGPGEARLHWSNQVIANAMYRMGYEQMSENKGYIVAPEDGIVDWAGEPFIFSNENGRIIYRTDDAVHGKIDFFQPNGLNPAWSTYVSHLDGNFNQTKGTGELGLTAQASKDIPVGTIRALTETGDVPVDHKIKRLRDVETYIENNVLDMARATWNEARFVRVLGPMGQMAAQQIRSSNIPSADIRIFAEPSIHATKADEANTYLQLAQMPPHIRRFVASSLGFSPSALRQLERDEIAMRQTAGPTPDQKGRDPRAEGQTVGAPGSEPQMNGVQR